MSRLPATLSMKSFLYKHPLLAVIVVAAILRLIAAVFSQGYMAHDDHFETVRIAWVWNHDGMFEHDGTLRWIGKPDIGVMRSAAYNIFLLGMMKVTSLLGIDHLQAHQYLSRMIHALLSILPILFGFKYLREETDTRTALLGGLILSTHFLMPFLAVRNLVEMVSANLLFPSLYFAHRSAKRGSDRDACVSAFLGGLAFMVRLHVGLVLLAVPAAMVISGRAWRQAAVFSTATLLMVVLQGGLDIWTHGAFLRSMTNYIEGNLAQPPAVPAPWYRYVLLILGIMIPPFSITFVLSIFNSRVIRGHLILWSGLLLFVLAHSAVVNKQERFIIPVFPVLIVLGCIGLYHLYNEGSWYFRWRKLRTVLWAWFWIVNLTLLIPFTLNYGHRGVVDPMVYLSRQGNVGTVLFDMSERRSYLPYGYWDYTYANSVRLTPTFSLDDALAAGSISRDNPPSYIVVFTDGYPERRLAEVNAQLGLYEVVHHSEPSIIDLAAHKLNPKYNRKNESWVLKRLGETP